MSPHEKHWRAALVTCPCCQFPKREENKPEDGIPAGNLLEIVYSCGAAVFITETGARTGRACDDPMDQALEALASNVEGAIDNEEDDEVAA